MEKRMIFILCFVAGILTAFTAIAQESVKKGGETIFTDQNRQLILRLFGEVFNQHTLPVIEELYDPNVVDHAAFPDQAPGVAGIHSTINSFFEMFDDLHITVEDVMAEDDKVVTRETWRATHKPSGKNVSGSVIHIFRIRDHKIADEWSCGWGWLEKL